MSDTLHVAVREKVGTRNNDRLRSEGKLPGVLYGHKEAPVNLSIPTKELQKALQHNAKLVDLEGDVTGQAVVQALQWDTFHRDLLHIDLLRVDADETVSVTVPLALKGEAPGQDEGGLVEQTLLQIEIEANPSSMPEVLHVDVSGLHKGGSLTAGDIIDLPKGAKLITPPGELAVHCVQPAGEPDLDTVAEPAGEPEVQSKGKKEEE